MKARIPTRLLAGFFVLTALPLAVLAQVPMMPLGTTAQACHAFAQRLRSVDEAKCLALELRADAGSQSGFPLVFKDFAPRPANPDAPRILMIGGMHGDELTSVSLSFLWMERLQTERLQSFHWRVIPASNPDGLLARPSRRMNLGGIDLNRNFPSADWDARAMDYWKRRTGSDPRRFPGAAALSAPEAQWLTAHIAAFQPHAIVSVHAPYGLLDFDGPQKPPRRFGPLHLRQLGIFPGSLGNYAGVDLGLPVITLELPHAGLMPSPSHARRIWTDMLTWLSENLPKRAYSVWHPPLLRPTGEARPTDPSAHLSAFLPTFLRRSDSPHDQSRAPPPVWSTE